jgi:Ca-activated chloride channel family protein
MSFERPEWLWLLAALPILALLEWRAGSRAARLATRLAGERREGVLLEQRLPGGRRVGAALRIGALALLGIGAAAPEWGYQLVRRSAFGAEVVLAVDVSASMDVRDVPPSRLEEARREALAVLDQLGGSKVGVVAFAGDAARLCPLTLDRSAARLVLESLSTTTLSEPGTTGQAFAPPRLLPAKRRGEQAIVVWTDGEDLEDGARGAIDELSHAGVRVFAIGVGTPGGDIVPVLDDQDRVVDVKRDASGGPVRSRLDERMLQALARRTRGIYFSAVRPGGEITRLISTLAPLGRAERHTGAQRLVERPVARFPWFAAGAALFLGLDLQRRRRRTPDAIGRRANLARAALLLGLLALPRRGEAQSDWAKGDDAFRGARWTAAESLYARRLARDQTPDVRVNLATVRARAGKAELAKPMLRDATSTPGKAGQTASYNLGTREAEGREYEAALRDLRAAIERNPRDQDARHNYEWVLREMQRPPRPQSQSNPPPSRSRRSRAAGLQQQQGNNGPPPPQPSQPQPTPAPPEMGHGLDRQQAEQLLGSLQELERLEQQRMRKVRVMRERRGRDW